MAIHIHGQADFGQVQTTSVRIVRIEPGASVCLRMLSESIGGLITHWDGKKSKYCIGEGCPSNLHSRDRTWKGYVAAQQFRPLTKDWLPVVLELTEHAELDMREAYQRGQEWVLERRFGSNKKAGPVTASLHKPAALQALPAPFDVLRVLVHVYHCNDISLNVKNPLPPRLVLPIMPHESKNPGQNLPK